MQWSERSRERSSLRENSHLSSRTLQYHNHQELNYCGQSITVGYCKITILTDARSESIHLPSLLLLSSTLEWANTENVSKCPSLSSNLCILPLQIVSSSLNHFRLISDLYSHDNFIGCSEWMDQSGGVQTRSNTVRIVQLITAMINSKYTSQEERWAIVSSVLWKGRELKQSVRDG